MLKEQVKLRFREGAPSVYVRDLTGLDERRVRDASTRSAVDLLQHVVEWPQGIAIQADELTALDRDRLLAAVYQRNYGKRVDSTAVCTVCSSPYDISFSLDDLVAAVDGSADSAAVQSLPDGTFRSASGLRFRLPVARDEIEVADLPPQQAAETLALRCLMPSPTISGAAADDSLKALETAVEGIAPMLDLDINTACPECGARQVIRFDLQFFLLRAICQDRQQLARDVHRIASAYGWGLDQILAMERHERRTLVQLIEGDMAARRRGQ